MKKLIAFLVLCSFWIVFMVSASSSAYAHEEIPTYYSAGGGAGGGTSGAPGDGIWVEICKFIGQVCKEVGICILADGLLACLLDGDNAGLTEMPICACTNGFECFQKCSCGFSSGNRGPVIFEKHKCGSQPQ